MSEGFPIQDERSHDVERDHAMALAGDAVRAVAAEGRAIITANEQGNTPKVNYADIDTQPNPVVMRNAETLFYTEVKPHAGSVVEALDDKAAKIEAWAGILHDKPVDPKVAESWAPEREGDIDYSTAEGLVKAESELTGLKSEAEKIWDERHKIYDRGADVRELNANSEVSKPVIDEIRGLEALIDTAKAGNMISKEQYQAIAYGTHTERLEALAS
jgi:hypothetical protein